MTPEQATRLRELVVRHGHCQFRAGRLSPETNPDVRARVYAAADEAARAVSAAITEFTKEKKDYEIL